MLVTSVPYLVGFGVQGEGWRFTGFVIGAQDGNSYIAKMLSGAAGNWLFKSPYSAEVQKGVVAFLPYLLLGKLTSPPAQHEQLVVLYHLFRFLAGVLAILASYDFLSIFTQRKNLRYGGLVMVAVGGGLGWVLVIIQQKGFLGSLPVDFISPESFGFLGLLGFPHLTAARALFLWGFVAYLTKNKGWLTGLLWLGMGFFQPMFILIAWCVISLHVLVMLLLGRFQLTWTSRIGLTSREMILSSFQAILVSSPLVLYTSYSFLTDPYLKGWTAQNILPSPHWIHYLIAYGLVLPFAVTGVIKGLKDHPRIYLLLAVWMMIFPILIYAPVTTQRRLAEGIWVALIAGTISYFSTMDRIPRYTILLMFLVIPSSLFLLIGSISRASSPSWPSFLPAEQVQAYQFLAEEAPTDSLVLSEFKTGNSLPAWAPVRVVLGHGPETVNQSYWQGKVERTLNGVDSVDPCISMFQQEGIDYLFWGPNERDRWRFEPKQSGCLSRMYNSGEYQIYIVEY